MHSRVWLLERRWHAMSKSKCQCHSFALWFAPCVLHSLRLRLLLILQFLLFFLNDDFCFCIRTDLAYTPTLCHLPRILIIACDLVNDVEVHKLLPVRRQDAKTCCVFITIYNAKSSRILETVATGMLSLMLS